jgi:hypothetical protein
MPTSRPTSTNSFGITGMGQTSLTASIASATSTTTAKPNGAMGWTGETENIVGVSFVVIFVMCFFVI